jgi:uncharacterized protein with HEPN domain
MEFNRDITVLKRILGEIKTIEQFTKGQTFEMFMNNEEKKRAVAMTLINIGELSRHFTKEFQKSAECIPFNEIRAMRNVAAHGYEQLRFEFVWDTIKTDLPELKSIVNRLLKN